MAEEQQGQEKTEEPTQRKLDKAREEGQAARSRELNTVALVTFGAVAMIAAAPGMTQSMLELTRRFFGEAASMSKGMMAYLGDSAMTGLSVFLPLGVVALCCRPPVQHCYRRIGAITEGAGSKGESSQSDKGYRTHLLG